MNTLKVAGWMIVAGLSLAISTDGLFKNDALLAKEQRGHLLEQIKPKKTDAKPVAAVKPNRKDKEKAVERDAGWRKLYEQQPIATSTPPLQLPPPRPPVREP